MAGTHPTYTDRAHAGQVLATELRCLAGRSDVVVLALLRGGIAVAAPVAAALSAPLAAVAVRKIGVQAQPELAMGALAAVGDQVEVIRNDDVVRSLGISSTEFQEVVDRQRAELSRQQLMWGGAPTQIEARVAVVVDDGLATGATMVAAVRVLRRLRPSKIVVAVPVGAAEAVALLSGEADAVVCPSVPRSFRAVGVAYSDFTQVSDREVLDLLPKRPQT